MILVWFQGLDGVFPCNFLGQGPEEEAMAESVWEAALGKWGSFDDSGSRKVSQRSKSFPILAIKKHISPKLKQTSNQEGLDQEGFVM